MKKIERVVIRTKKVGRGKIAIVKLVDVKGVRHVREMPFSKSYYWRNLKKLRKWHVDYCKTHRRSKNKNMMEYYRAHSSEINGRRRRLYHADIKEARRKARLASAKWRASRRKHISDYSRARRYERLEYVFRQMGGECKCCGETERGFLTVDHVNGGGNKNRKKHHYAWRKFCRDIEESGFDPKLYQVLCYNCNCGRARNEGICPHKKPFVAPKVKTIKPRLRLA